MPTRGRSSSSPAEMKPRILIVAGGPPRELESRYDFRNILGDAPEMMRALKMTGDVAKADTTVLILGESGTGKELVARAIHFNSPRARGPFIPLNCAAIPENLLES